MKDHLKEFVDLNREEFNLTEPRDLWLGISAGLNQAPPTFLNFKKFKNMFKYGFGASALMIGTFFIFNSLFQPKTQKAAVKVNSNFHIPSHTVKEKVNTVITSSSIPSIDESTSPQHKSSKSISSLKTPMLAGDTNEGNKDNLVMEVNPYSNPANSVNHKSWIPNSKRDSDTSNSFQILDTVFKGVKSIKIKSNFCEVSVIGQEREDVGFKGNTLRSRGSIKLGIGKTYLTQEKIKFMVEDSILTVWVKSEKRKKGEKLEEHSDLNNGLHFLVPHKTHVIINNNMSDIQVSNIIDTNLQLTSRFGNINADRITGNLHINNVSGDVNLSKIKGDIQSTNKFGNQKVIGITGNLKLINGSGDIKLNSIRGDVVLNTSFGNQKIDSMIGNLTATAKSGDISITKINGKITSTSTFGNQRMKFVEGNVAAKANSGDIVLTDVNGMLSLETTFGDITGKNIQLFQSGDFKSSSGNINFEFLNEANQLSYDLNSSSGSLEVNKGGAQVKSDNKIKVERGPILIKGNSSFGNQKYK